MSSIEQSIQETGQLQKRQMRALFDEVAPVYDSADFFSLFGRSLVGWAEPPRRGRILDLAAGRGAVLEHLLPVTDELSIYAADISGQMLFELRQTCLRAGHGGVLFGVMDAERLAFADASFEAVFCGFALNMVPDPAAALREIHRVMRPGGTVAISLPGPAIQNPFPAYSATIARFGRLVDPERWTISELRQPERALAAVGFAEVMKTHDEVVIPVSDPEAFWQQEMAHGLRGFCRALPDGVPEQFRQEVLDVFRRDRSAVKLVGRGAYLLRAVKPVVR